MLEVLGIQALGDQGQILVRQALWIGHKILVAVVQLLYALVEARRVSTQAHCIQVFVVQDYIDGTLNWTVFQLLQFLQYHV